MTPKSAACSNTLLSLQQARHTENFHNSKDKTSCSSIAQHSATRRRARSHASKGVAPEVTVLGEEPRGGMHHVAVAAPAAPSGVLEKTPLFSLENKPVGVEVVYFARQMNRELV